MPCCTHFMYGNGTRLDLAVTRRCCWRELLFEFANNISYIQVDFDPAFYVYVFFHFLCRWPYYCCLARKAALVLAPPLFCHNSIAVSLSYCSISVVCAIPMSCCDLAPCQEERGSRVARDCKKCVVLQYLCRPTLCSITIALHTNNSKYICTLFFRLMRHLE